MNMLRQMFQLSYTLLLIEFRTLSSLMVSGLYLLISLFVFTVALPKEIIPSDYANSGVLWTTVFLSTSSLASYLFIARQQNDWTDSILMTGMSAIQIFLSRWFVLFLFMIFMTSIAFPLLLLFSDSSLPSTFSQLAVMIILTCASYSAIAVLFSSLMAKEKFTDLLLPVLILPIAVPLLIVCVRATTDTFLGNTPQGLFFLFGYSLIMLPCSTLLSEYVIEME